jgi:cytochrome b
MSRDTTPLGDLGDTQPGQLQKVLVWDPYIRVFHWSLVVCFVAAIVTAKVGGDWLAWHGYCGYAISALVVFRVLWGFVGGEFARFRSFVASPASSLRYGYRLLRGSTQHVISHNPLGAVMVMVLLGSLGFQSVLGMVGDNEITSSGPLSRYVSSESAAAAMRWHRLIGDVLLGLVALHVVAVLFHVFVKKEHLVSAMIDGQKSLPAELAERAKYARRASNVAGCFCAGISILAMAIALNWATLFLG